MRNLPRYPKGHSKEGKIDWGQAISNTIHRTAMTLTLGNPRKLGEIFNEFIYAFGKNWPKGVGYYYLWMWGIKRTVFPIVLGLADEIYYGWTRESGSKDLGAFFKNWGNFIKERIKDTFVQYDKTFDEASKMDKYELNWWKSIRETLNPFEFLWDDIVNIADWHDEGGARKAWERFYENMQQRAEANQRYLEARAQQIRDSAQNAAIIDSMENVISNLNDTISNRINPDNTIEEPDI